MVRIKFFQPSVQHIAQITLFLIAACAINDRATAVLMLKHTSKVNLQVNF